MVGRTNAGGGGKLKYASGNATAGSNKILTVTGLGFKPYAVYADFGNEYGRGFICDADRNLVVNHKQGSSSRISQQFTFQIFDDGFTMEFENFGPAGYNWYAIGV